MITPPSMHHGRDHDRGSISSGLVLKPAARHIRVFVLMASLWADATTASSHMDATSPLFHNTIGIKGRDHREMTRVLFADLPFGKMGNRKIQMVDEVSDHDHDGEASLFESDHDHGDEHDHEGETIIVEQNEEHLDHEEHDHEEEVDLAKDYYYDHLEEEIFVDNHVDHDHDEEDHDEHEDEGEIDVGEEYDDHEHAAQLSSTGEFSEILSEEVSSKPWGVVIVATLVVNLATLTGLLLMALPAIRKGFLTASAGQKQSHGKFIDIIIPSFAVGALMATTVFLVVPEALHLIEGAHSESQDENHDAHAHRFLQDGDEDHSDNTEGVAAAKLGCGILGGFLLPVFLSIFFHTAEQDDDEEDSALPNEEEECRSCMAEKDLESNAVPQDQEVVTTAVYVHDSESAIDVNEAAAAFRDETSLDQEPPVEPLVIKTKTFINYRLGASILIGDAFHNFADGLFIGAAFLGCSWATAISITAVSLFHEMAQELADFILLTRYAGLTIPKACLLNFVSGLSVCLGGITVLAAKPSDEAIGIILAFAGGVYTNIAACESMPRVERFMKDRNDRTLTFFSIILGTIPIGLILLDHKHC